MQVEDPLAGCTHETITRHTFTGFEEWRCSVCAEPFAPSLDAEKRITFAADALAVVERRRDDLESKLDRSLGALRELHATVLGESPSLLNEDSGGNGRLAIEIEDLLK